MAQGRPKRRGDSPLEAGNHIKCALDLLGALPSSERRNERELELTLTLAVPLIAPSASDRNGTECALRAKEFRTSSPGPKTTLLRNG